MLSVLINYSSLIADIRISFSLAARSTADSETRRLIVYRRLDLEQWDEDKPRQIQLS